MILAPLCADVRSAMLRERTPSAVARKRRPAAGTSAVAVGRSHTSPMEDVMAKILVGTYRSRGDAADARQRLIEQGIDPSRVRLIGPGAEEASATGANVDIEGWNEAPSGRRSLTEWIGLMFSGMLPAKAQQERYEHLVRGGATLLSVHDLTDTQVDQARPVLAQHGTVDEHLAEAVVARGGPDEIPLPNAPVGWNESIEGERSMPAGDLEHDPARPEGVVRGANELGATEDRERIGRRSR
jgi:hypothetical protein